MDRVRAALLVAGVLNLVLLGAVACGERPGQAAPADLADRVLRLEAWRAAKERDDRERDAAGASQREVNRSFESYMRTASEHAASVDHSLATQSEAISLLNTLLQDLLKKLK